MRTLSTKLVRDIGTHRAQFISLVVLVALGVACFVGLNAAYKNLAVSYEHTYDTLHLADAQFTVESAPQDVVAKIAALSGVEGVEGRTVLDTGMFLPNGDQIRVRLVGLPASNHPTVNDVHIESGRYFRAADAQVALLQSAFAEYHQFESGTTLRVLLHGDEYTFTAVGVAASPEYLFLSPSEQEIIASPRNFGVLFVPQETLAKLAGTEGAVNQIGVTVADPQMRAAVIERAETLLKPYGLSRTLLQENIPSVQALQLDLEGYREMAFTVPTMILIIAAMSVYIALSRIVQSQRVTVGLTKALGYGNGAVVRHYLALALAIGILGCAIGILGGVFMGDSVTRIYADELGIPLVATRFYPEFAIGGVVLSLLFCALGGVWPARGAARMQPAQAMRLDPSIALVKGRVPLLERILGHILRLPLSFRLALRNIFRVRRRSLASGLGVVFAFMLVLSIWSMFDSIDWMLDTQYETIERWDISAVYDQPKTEAIATTAESWDGVSAAETILQLPGKVKVGTTTKDIFIVGLTPDEDSLHHLRLGKGQTPAQVLGDSQAVIGPILAGNLGIEIGDTVHLETPWGSGDFTFSAESAEMLAGTSVYIALADAQAMVKYPAVNGLYLSVAPEHQKDVSKALYQTGAAGVQIKEETREDFRSVMGLIYVFMGVLLAFSLIVAAAILFNAMTVSVLERQREIATFRALGESRGRITASIILENLILWGLALVPGLLMGYATALELGTEFNSELFRFEVVIQPLSYVIVAGGILLTMLLASVPAIRRVNRLRLAEATKVLT